MKIPTGSSREKRAPRPRGEKKNAAGQTAAARGARGKKPGLFKRLPWLRHVLIVLGLIGVGLFFLYREVDLQTLQARALEWNAGLVFALLAEGFGRSSLFEFPVLLAVLLYGSGLVFVRTLERWL